MFNPQQHADEWKKFWFCVPFWNIKISHFDKWNTEDFRKGIVLNDNFYEFAESETSSSFLYYLNNIPPYVQAEMQYIQHKANK